MSKRKNSEWLIKEAERKLNSWMFWAKEDNRHDACELYVQAANIYKISKDWRNATTNYVLAGDIILKNNETREAIIYYRYAVDCYKRFDEEMALTYLEKVIELATQEGDLRIIAKTQRDIADLYERRDNMEEAAKAYLLAADYMDISEQQTSANTCRLRAADIMVLYGNYERPIKIYEDVAGKSLDNNLLKWKAKEFFLRAGVLYLANNDIGYAKEALDKYLVIYPGFARDREYGLLSELIKTVENGDLDGFILYIQEYDNISKLDNWMTKVLLKIKKSIRNDDPFEGGLA